MMTIHRKVEPDADAWDQLAEVLYELLLDGSSNDQQGESPHPALPEGRVAFPPVLSDEYVSTVYN